MRGAAVRAEHGDILLHHRVEIGPEHLKNAGDRVIFRGLRQKQVKLLVGLGHFRLRFGPLHLERQFPQARDGLASGSLGGKPRDLSLENAPELKKIGPADIACAEQLGPGGLLRRFADERAPALIGLHQSLRREPAQRTAHRKTAGLKNAAELCLGGELLSGRKFAVRDLLFQLFCYFYIFVHDNHLNLYYKYSVSQIDEFVKNRGKKDLTGTEKADMIEKERRPSANLYDRFSGTSGKRITPE